ncbi:MAG: hypothetical protein IH948_07905, partial [Bacteroidetes bacterium]|nr:hypothetical protein [Bacteroidota bacterium]
YITDGYSDDLYRIKDGKLETWLTSKKIRNSNGILFDGEKLIIGVNEDHKLKSIDLKTKEVKIIAEIEGAMIDGIKKMGKDYLITNYYGQVFLVRSSGEVVEWLDTRDKNIICADFEYIEKDQLIIIPDLDNNVLHGYKVTVK